MKKNVLKKVLVLAVPWFVGSSGQAQQRTKYFLFVTISGNTGTTWLGNRCESFRLMSMFSNAD